METRVKFFANFFSKKTLSAVFEGLNPYIFFSGWNGAEEGGIYKGVEGKEKFFSRLVLTLLLFVVFLHKKD